MATGMTLLTYVIAGVIGLGLLLYVISMYNALVMLRNNVDKAWSNIDVLLKQRSDELPKLIDSAKEYMEYEEDVLQKVTEARTQVQKAKGPKQEAAADSMLRKALGDLFAVAEDYPDLKASKNFQQLQDRISSIEEQIADRREFYNESVNTYNIRINQIPHNMVAGMLSYTEKELFEVADEDREDIDVGAAFDA